MSNADVRNEMLRLIGETLHEHRPAPTSYASSRGVEAEVARLAQAIYEAVVEDVVRQREMLATAIEEVVVEAGIIRPDHGGLTGPQLLQFLDDLKDGYVRLAAEAPTHRDVAPACPSHGTGIQG